MTGITRALNELLGGNSAFDALKKKLRAKSPRLAMRLKAGFGSLDDEATWAKLLSTEEREQLYLVRQFDAPPDEVAGNRRLNDEFLREQRPVASVNWLIPPFEHAYGGIVTILRFAARLRSAHGVESRIVIYDFPGAKIVNPVYPALDIEHMRGQIARIFPALAEQVMLHTGERMDDLPASDACVATYWTSAYLSTKVTNTRARFYFIQDYEPSFNEGGTKFGLIDTTYSLGHLRIVNTPGLLDWIKVLHGGDGTAFVPSVDRKVYHAATEKAPDAERVRVFFYARPGASRNGFILGMEALRKVKERYGDRVEIITAGAEWNPLQYGVGDVLDNLGLLKTADEVAALYRSCDIGVVFMYSKHPSYQPFEFMASGCCVVTNENKATEWLLKNNENCLLTTPTAGAVAEAVGTLIEDPALRRRLSEAGYASLPRAGWDETIDETCRRAGLLPAQGRAGDAPAANMDGL